MTIYYRLSSWDSKKLWKTVPEKFDAQTLSIFATEILEKFSGYDNDNGYSEYAEFDLNGTRMYAYARYESAYVDPAAPMTECTYGTFEQITRFYGKYAIERFKYGPTIDWILIDSAYSHF